MVQQRVAEGYVTYTRVASAVSHVATQDNKSPRSAARCNLQNDMLQRSTAGCNAAPHAFRHRPHRARCERLSGRKSRELQSASVATRAGLHAREGVRTSPPEQGLSEMRALEYPHFTCSEDGQVRSVGPTGNADLLGSVLRQPVPLRTSGPCGRGRRSRAGSSRCASSPRASHGATWRYRHAPRPTARRRRSAAETRTWHADAPLPYKPSAHAMGIERARAMGLDAHVPWAASAHVPWL